MAVMQSTTAISEQRRYHAQGINLTIRPVTSPEENRLILYSIFSVATKLKMSARINAYDYLTRVKTSV